jgi:flavorubredoxin
MIATVHEIADGIFRLSTSIPPSPELPPGFTFNQILIRDDEPLLFHTGPRRLFPVIREAVAKVLPPESLRWVAFSHHEADENGSLAEWLALAPRAAAVCSRVAALVGNADAGDRPARPLADGEMLALGHHTVQWFDAPHVPHGWDTGYLGETTTRTLLCGDLFTQGGADLPPVVETDLVGPSEGMRAAMDYYAHGRGARKVLARLAAFEPRVLATMHGSSFRGDGGKQLLALADALGA